MTYSVERGMRVQRAIQSFFSEGYASLQVKQSQGVSSISFENELLATYEGSRSKVRVFETLLVLQKEHHEAVHALLTDKLQGLINIPDGHVFYPDFCNMLAGIANHQSCRVRKRRDPDAQVRHTLAAEFRVFMDEPRATLFVDYGPQFAFQDINLLQQPKDAHQYAESYEELFDNLARIYNSSLDAIPEAEATLVKRQQSQAE